MDSQFNNNKVYINPNYKPGKNKGNQHIYINQNFLESKYQSNSVNKIFVNPNFMKTNNVSKKNTCRDSQQYSSVNHLSTLNLNPHYNSKFFQEAHFSNQVLNGPHLHSDGHINKSHSNVNHLLQSNSQSSNQLSHQGHLNKMNTLAVKCNNTDITQDNITSKSRYILVRNQYSQKIDKANSPQITQSCGLHKGVPINRLPISKSRYQLIRHKERINPDQSSLIKKGNLKVSKYNIINLDSIKSKIGTKYSLAKPISFSSSKILNNHDFKIKTHLSYTLKSKEKVRGVFNHTKKTNYKSEIENIKGKTKINNIPCALFCKYGKCLRNINSKCPYVHDKKLVSLCRKFLKGVCHDENCPLSHEISKKKMPTCYFYLNGVCVKDNCPYLHVKLGDQASICKDFLKGYCEKGETCLFKHVKPKISRNVIQFTKNIKECLKLKKNIPSTDKKDLLPDKPSTSSEENTAIEDRYFKEAVQEDLKNSDYIKPTRCKLGDLPSYIKL
ncbi:zinc finger CCCH domain-containing protein C337.12 [Pieris brassicae]|uniref:zinc finger CCCH domain-containing protein C337.12 n=1 Tax=Pieris brassicae TaxID=7116 RepID=UPI001E661AB6|nr:zinc finger CCCH domain-containing protein C337.12 [Pieris brassicae]